MGTLNLAGLKLMDEPLNENKTKESIPTENKIESSGDILPQNEVLKGQKEEGNNNTGGFTISLSSLIGGDISTIEPAVKIEPRENISERVSEKNSDSTPLITGISIGQNISSNDGKNTDENSSITGISIGIENEVENSENDSTSISLSQITEEIEAKENINSSTDIIDDNQPKEFFKNFNVIDVFAEEKKNKKEEKIELNKPQDIILSQEETKENLSINETNEQNIPVSLIPLTLPIESVTPNTSSEDSKIQEDNSPVLEITSENQNNNTPDSTLIEKEITPEENSTVGNSEIIEVQDTNTISNNNQVSDTPQETSNKINDVEQVKKDLSGERKLGGLQFFKKKSVIFSILGILIISGGLGTMFFGGNSETGKTNIQETIIDTNSGKENNENKGTYSEGSDFSINKNKKKNIKKVKPIKNNLEDEVQEENINQEIINTGNELDNNQITEDEVQEENINQEIINTGNELDNNQITEDDLNINISE